MPAAMFVIAFVLASSAVAVPVSSIPQKDWAVIAADTRRCEVNAGRNEAIGDELVADMERITKRKFPRGAAIGQANHTTLVRWFACLSRHTTDGGDEEFSLAANFCSEFSDSAEFRANLRRLAMANPALRQFRRNLVEYARSSKTRCD